MTLDIDKLEAAATASSVPRVHEWDDTDSFGVRWYRLCSVDEPTAEFVGEARQHVLDLVAEVRRLRIVEMRSPMAVATLTAVENDKLRAALVEACDMVKSYWPIEDDRKRADMLRQLAEAK